MQVFGDRVYLASRSPRRRELLAQIGVKFHLLLFRDLAMTREQFIAFSRRFGELDLNEARPAETKIDSYPELMMVVSRPSDVDASSTRTRGDATGVAISCVFIGARARAAAAAVGDPRC